MTAPRPSLSIVTPAYNEALSIPALHERLCAVLGAGRDWEMIVINDGSSDDSYAVLRDLHQRDPRVRSVHLLLNSGHMKALVAGIDHAEGDLVITMDADLQHPPDVIPEIIARWKAGALVVNTIRLETRHESFMKKLSSRLYYDLFRRLTGIPIRPGMADFRGIDRKVVLMLREYREDTVPIRFLLAKLPFPSAEIPYEPRQRFAGTTKYTVSKMLAFATESLFSFSLAPLYFGYLIGGLFLVLFALYGLYVLYVRLVLGQGIAGWSSQILVILAASGVQFILIGILGGYVGAVLREVKQRPRYVVGGRIGFEDKADSGPKTAELVSPTAH
jgi:glycosyltransferase involved in cell wall biosynthesis